MKVVRTKETAILTAQEKAILDKALEILEDIAKDCEDCEDLWTYAHDASKELECFLVNGKNDFYTVEPLAEGVSKLVIEIKL